MEPLKISAIQPFTPARSVANNYVKNELLLPEQEPSQMNGFPPLGTMQAYSNVSFGYSCPLKTLYKQGKIKIRYSFYGGRLKRNKASLEHIIPKAKGGKSEQSNYVLCNQDQNFERGTHPIENYLNWKHVGKYLEQFRGVKVGPFNGDEYIKNVLNSLNEALQNGK